MPDSKNFLLAIILSMLVLVGWQYYFAEPAIQQARRDQAAPTETVRPDRPSADSSATLPSPGVAPGAAPGAGAPGPSATTPALTRPAAIAASPRVEIATPSLSGSINLVGARLDDLRLTRYRETVEPTSPTIVLLSPSTAPNGYFAEFGWLGPNAETPTPVATTRWTSAPGARLTPETPVTLTYDNGAGLVFTRMISVDSEFMFEVKDSVANRGSGSVSITPYSRVARIGEPSAASNWLLHEGPIGVFGESGLDEPSYNDVREAETKALPMPAADRGWLGLTDKYWATALVPTQGKHFESRFKFFDVGLPMYQAEFSGEPVVLAAGATAENATRLFAGAKEVNLIDGYEASLGIERFELLIDWGWFYFITKPLFYVIDWIFRFSGNFGLAILGVTVLIKAVFFPLANKSYKSMSAMKKLQPEMLAIRERHKDDRAKQQEAMMALYKKEKVNPVAGCWPILIQIPVFFALYKVLLITIEMRHAPFFGWIQDLAAPDPTSVFNLFGLLPFAVPAFLLIGVWPLIMGMTMFVQMRLNPPPPDPTQQMIFTWMPVVFTFMLASFPAGLVIYWAWNNFLSILQQYVIMRRQGVEVDLWGNIATTFKKKQKAANSNDAKG